MEIKFLYGKERGGLDLHLGAASGQHHASRHLRRSKGLASW